MSEVNANPKAVLVHGLNVALRTIEENDPSSPMTFAFKEELEAGKEAQDFYDIRNHMIHEAIYQARHLGMKAGYVVHQPVEDIIEKEWDETWGVVAFIELPTGQVSWHIESPKYIYDGHGYQDKTNRIQKFLQRD